MQFCQISSSFKLGWKRNRKEPVLAQLCNDRLRSRSSHKCTCCLPDKTQIYLVGKALLSSAVSNTRISVSTASYFITPADDCVLAVLLFSWGLCSCRFLHLEFVFLSSLPAMLTFLESLIKTTWSIKLDQVPPWLRTSPNAMCICVYLTIINTIYFLLSLFMSNSSRIQVLWE